MKVSIIKYNAGNVYSVECALRRLGVTPVVSDSPDVLSQSDNHDVGVLRLLLRGGREDNTALGGFFNFRVLENNAVKKGFQAHFDRPPYIAFQLC